MFVDNTIVKILIKMAESWLKLITDWSSITYTEIKVNKEKESDFYFKLYTV